MPRCRRRLQPCVISTDCFPLQLGDLFVVNMTHTDTCCTGVIKDKRPHPPPHDQGGPQQLADAGTCKRTASVPLDRHSLATQQRKPRRAACDPLNDLGMLTLLLWLHRPCSKTVHKSQNVSQLRSTNRDCIRTELSQPPQSRRSSRIRRLMSTATAPSNAATSVHQS